MNRSTDPVRRARLAAALFAFLMLTLLSTSALAHKLGQSYVFLRVADAAIEGRIEITAADANRFMGLDLPLQGLTADDVARHLPTVAAYLTAHVSFAPNGVAQPLLFSGHGVDKVPLAEYVVMRFALADGGRAITNVDVDYRVGFDEVPEHRGLLVIEHHWGSGTFNDESNVLLVFDPQSTLKKLDLSRSNLWTGVRAMIGLGTHHIWVGIDHILFLVALLLPAVVRRKAGQWQPVADFRSAFWHVFGVVTVFTAAHTITLSLAALDIASLPSRVVESVIAVSIAVAAADVLYPVFGKRIWLIVFGFGLFHGFGFASVLRDMGIPSNYLMYSLIGFNLGVELGQLAIVCVIFPLLFAIRGTAFYRRVVLRYGAVGLILVAAYWFTERVLEIDLPLGAILQWPIRQLL